MRLLVPIFCLTLLAYAAAASAGSNTNYLAPAYRPCEEGLSNCPAALESTFTFETVKLKTASAPYLKDDKVAVAVELKGVRDQAGTLVTTDPADGGDDFRLIVPGTQITLFGLTYAPGAGPGTDIVVRIDLKNGKGKASYKTPAGGEGTGVVAEATATPYVVDNQGNRFAVSGSRDKPAE